MMRSELDHNTLQEWNKQCLSTSNAQTTNGQSKDIIFVKHFPKLQNENASAVNEVKKVRCIVEGNENSLSAHNKPDLLEITSTFGSAAMTHSSLRKGNAALSSGPPRHSERRRRSEGLCKYNVSFNPKVWIHNYERSEWEISGMNWLDVSEIKHFKRDFIRQIQKQQFLSPTIVSLEKDTNCAVTCSSSFVSISSSEVRNVLIVDSQPMFSLILRKGMKRMMPNVDVKIADTISEAIELIEEEKMRHTSDAVTTPSHEFDIIIIGDRLISHNSSRRGTQKHIALIDGPELINKIMTDQKKTSKKDTYCRYSFVIGVSAHNCTRKKFESSGADVVWEKPPPLMNDDLRRSLVDAIMEKRSNKSSCTNPYAFWRKFHILQ